MFSLSLGTFFWRHKRKHPAATRKAAGTYAAQRHHKTKKVGRHTVTACGQPFNFSCDHIVGLESAARMIVTAGSARQAGRGRVAAPFLSLSESKIRTQTPRPRGPRNPGKKPTARRCPRGHGSQHKIGRSNVNVCGQPFILLAGKTSEFYPPYAQTTPYRRRPIPLARAGSNGLPQDCAERIEDSHAQDADLSEFRAVSEGRVRRRLGRAVWRGVSSSPGSPFLWVLSFGDAKESIPPPRGKRQKITPRSGITRQKVGRNTVTACGQLCGAR